MTTVTPRTGRAGAVLAGTLAVVLVVAIAVAGPTPARADDSFVAGSGSAAASAIQVGPKAGGLALTQLFGESVAGYIGTAAQAASQTVDTGLLGTLLTQPHCDGSPSALTPDQVPTATRVDSRDAGADNGRSRIYGGTPDGNMLRVQAGREEVWAYKDPRGKSRTTVDVASLPGVVDLHNGVAQTETGVVGGATRMARASVDLGDVDLFGGAVTISHLTWTAVQQTGKGAVAHGTFSIGSVSIGGAALPITAPAAALGALNQLTSQVGVTLIPPAVTQDNGVVEVSPLVLHLQSSPTEQSVISPALVALQPARQAITAALTKITCYVQTLITVGDVSLGPLTGSGAFDLGFGGATVTTEGARFDNPFASSGGGVDVLGSGLQAPSPSTASGPFGATTLTPGTPGTPGVAGTLGIGTLHHRGPGGGGLLAGVRSLPGHTGGWAILIGFLAVAGVAAVAGADWWRLRHAPVGGEE